jgi:HAD superfamily hydrolase (TIGR01549 family)
MNDNKFKAVFFDAEFTLFCEKIKRSQVYLDAAAEYGSADLSMDFVEAELSRALSTTPSSINGQVKFSRAWWITYNANVFAALDLSTKDAGRASKTVVAHFSKATAYMVYPEVAEVLKVLSSAGIQTGLIANWSEDLPVLAKRLKLEKLLDFIIPSAELRAEKPNRAIFDRALFRCGVAAESAIHIGADFERDISGALTAGMHALLVDRSKNAECGLHEGVKVINNLYDVLDICELTAHDI